MNDHQTMDEMLLDALGELHDIPEPVAHKQAMQRTQFLAEANRLRSSSSRPNRRTQNVLETGLGYLYRRASMAAVIIAIILAITGATSGVILASNNAAPGDPLFGVDTAVEDFRLSLTSSNEQHARLELQFAQERLDEAVELSEEGRFEASQEAINLMMAELDEVELTLLSGDLTNEEATALQAIIDSLRSALVNAELDTRIKYEFKFDDGNVEIEVEIGDDNPDGDDGESDDSGMDSPSDLDDSDEDNSPDDNDETDDSGMDSPSDLDDSDEDSSSDDNGETDDSGTDSPSDLDDSDDDSSDDDDDDDDADDSDDSDDRSGSNSGSGSDDSSDDDPDDPDESDDD